jgi:hypothetical protein
MPDYPYQIPQQAPIVVDAQTQKLFIQFLVDDVSIPEELKGQFWAFSDKEVAIANLDEAKAQKILNQYDDAVSAFIMSRPAYMYSFDDETLFTQMRSKLTIKLSRSIGGFERKQQTTQISQHVFEEVPQAKGGMVGRFFGGVKKMMGMSQ